MTKQSDYSDEERVVGGQARILKTMAQARQATSKRLEDGIARAEALAARLNVGCIEPAVAQEALISSAASVPSFAELAVTAPRDAGLDDALDSREIDAALSRLDAAGGRSDAETTLDRWDWVVAGAAGLLAGAADVVLVGLPQNPLTRFGANGGLLSNAVRSTFGRILPPDTVASLEKLYPVPYDPSTSDRLLKPVPGLYPKSHRFQSLGHDPLLGWFFGVRDVLNGSFTAIGRDGVLVVQEVTRSTAGQDLFVGLLSAFQSVGGHLLSDVSTPMGLPAPLMPLAQFFQFGRLGSEGYNVAETARRMYLQGYDFRHFTAGSLTTLIIEVIVRGAWIARRLHEGSSLASALPNVSIPRLRRQLLLAHATATSVNAGKVAVLQNPLALNWAQWLALLRYLGPEVLNVVLGPQAQAAAQNRQLDADLRMLAQSAQHLVTPNTPFWPPSA